MSEGQGGADWLTGLVSRTTATKQTFTDLGRAQALSTLLFSRLLIFHYICFSSSKMELDAENETNEVTNNIEKADFSNEEISLISPINNGSETIPAEIVAPHHDKEILEIVKATEEALGGEAAEPEENCENLPPDTNQDLDVETDTVREHLGTPEESVVFETNSPENEGPERLHLDTPQQETTCPQGEEDKEEDEEPTPAAPDFGYEENTQLLQELCEQREKAAQRSAQLQVKLVEYFRRTSGDETQVEMEKEDPEQQQKEEYERFMKILMKLKQQINTESETAQLQVEELRVQCQEKLDKVKDIWQAFMALKQDVAVSVLSRRLGKQAAQTKVESILAAEQLHQDELMKLRLKHLNLKTKVDMLEELRDEVQKKAALQIQFEHVQAGRQVQRQQTEKQNEESLKLQQKMNSSLEVGLRKHREEKD
ncbi:coiled-coil domain-containing protein 96 [Xyrichtys novacula]|uniref:Coiled-coil domain-containing protein 96 n=1 Tax=Xyrichtys novacula TaxID=13765 RepID=A0AAV1HLY4_XYRNO|nr:coiled-coil domain-containing protein 96 [Xyrichtys novacula]